MYTMVDYKTNVNSLYFNGSFQATPKLRINGALTFNKTKAEYDQVLMPNVEDRLVDGAGAPGQLELQDFDFSQMDTYSNLEYQLLRFAAGFEYRIAPDIIITVDGEYADLDDKAGYVYGIESGKYFMIRSGIGVEF